MPLIPIDITSSRRGPCVWPRPRPVTAVSTNAQPVILRGLPLGTTFLGYKVGPKLWLLSYLLSCPSFCFSQCPPQSPRANSVTSSWLQHFLHHPYFLSSSSWISFSPFSPTLLHPLFGERLQWPPEHRGLSRQGPRAVGGLEGQKGDPSPSGDLDPIYRSQPVESRHQRDRELVISKSPEESG